MARWGGKPLTPLAPSCASCRLEEANRQLQAEVLAAKAGLGLPTEDAEQAGIVMLGRATCRNEGVPSGGHVRTTLGTVLCTGALQLRRNRTAPKALPCFVLGCVLHDLSPSDSLDGVHADHAA